MTVAEQTPRIVLRRREAKANQRLTFHRDHAAVTVNVALNGDGEYQGGRLMFLQDGEVVCPSRGQGSVVVNDNLVVHGVSAVQAGTRYSLFVFVDADDSTGESHGFPFCMPIHP